MMDVSEIKKLMMPDELKLRELLWLTHGCGFLSMYGDDGEMQCHKCMLDFLRATPVQIETQFRYLSLKNLETK